MPQTDVSGNRFNFNWLKNIDWSHVGDQGMNIAHSLLAAVPNQGVDNTINNLSNDIKGIGSSLLMQSQDPVLKAVGLINQGLRATGAYADASEFDWKNKDGSINAQNTAMNIGNFINSFNPYSGWVAKAKEKGGPAAGLAVAMLNPNPLTMAQAIWGDTTINYTQNPDSVSSGYTGLNANASKMEGMDNTNLLFGARQQNQDIMRQMNKESQVADILTQNRNLQQFGNVQGYAQQYQTRQRGGWSPYGLVAGKKGTKLNKPFLKFYNSLPSELKGIKDFNMKRYWELHDKPITFVKSNQMFYKEGGKFKPYTVAYNRDNNCYEFMGNKEKELEWYNSDNEEAIQFRNDGWIPTDVAYIQKEITSFKEGGQMNVIPDGALHARLNNIGDDNLTRKGIPVVDNEGTQTAEVEKEEIIFTKFVTEQLEKWFKQYNESESEKEKNKLAIKCGKFLTEQILHNTDDKADLINKVE